MEFVLVLVATVLVYLVTVPIVINIFEIIRRKAAKETDASVSAVIRDALGTYRGGRG